MHSLCKEHAVRPPATRHHSDNPSTPGCSWCMLNSSCAISYRQTLHILLRLWCGKQRRDQNAGPPDFLITPVLIRGIVLVLWLILGQIALQETTSKHQRCCVLVPTYRPLVRRSSARQAFEWCIGKRELSTNLKEPCKVIRISSFR